MRCKCLRVFSQSEHFSISSQIASINEIFRGIMNELCFTFHCAIKARQYFILCILSSLWSWLFMDFLLWHCALNLIMRKQALLFFCSTFCYSTFLPKKLLKNLTIQPVIKTKTIHTCIYRQTKLKTMESL